MNKFYNRGLASGSFRFFVCTFYTSLVAFKNLQFKLKWRCNKFGLNQKSKRV